MLLETIIIYLFLLFIFFVFCFLFLFWIDLEAEKKEINSLLEARESIKNELISYRHKLTLLENESAKLTKEITEMEPKTVKAD